VTQDDYQLSHWKGEFGNEYIGRNLASREAVAQRLRAFSRILDCFPMDPPKSILEVWANIGINLRALSLLTPATLWALEPNDTARARLVADGVVPEDRALAGAGKIISMPDASVDMAFTSGVMIHIPPTDLEATCREMYRVASRFIVCIEYFADRPTAIPYRGRDDLLFKRDFGALWLETCPSLRLLDCGFFWKQATGMDNLTWWAFEKR
jgi:pseudaminic acid biosynthesis-associated methylase